MCSCLSLSHNNRLLTFCVQYRVNFNFRCRIQGINYLPYSSFSDCTTKAPATKLAAINTQFSFVDSTIKAVYAYAEALQAAQNINCGSTGFCQALRQMTPAEFHNRLKAVNFDVSFCFVVLPATSRSKKFNFFGPGC